MTSQAEQHQCKLPAPVDFCLLSAQLHELHIGGHHRLQSALLAAHNLLLHQQHVQGIWDLQNEKRQAKQT